MWRRGAGCWVLAFRAATMRASSMVVEAPRNHPRRSASVTVLQVEVVSLFPNWASKIVFVRVHDKSRRRRWDAVLYIVIYMLVGVLYFMRSEACMPASLTGADEFVEPGVPTVVDVAFHLTGWPLFLVGDVVNQTGIVSC